MDRGRNYLILTLTVLAGIGLSVFIYQKYGVRLFIFFIPIIGIGGSLFSRVMRRRPVSRRAEKPEYDDYKYRVRYHVEPDNEKDKNAIKIMMAPNRGRWVNRSSSQSAAPARIARHRPASPNNCQG